MKLFTQESLVIMIVCLFITFNTLESFGRSTFHAIIITQNDVSIGSARDRGRVPQEFKQIARLIDMDYKGKEFDRFDSGIAAYINNLSVQSDDVLFVYYSGHGSNSGSSIWPMFSNSENRFKLDRIYTKVKPKGCRLKVVFFDCCNHRTNRSINEGIRNSGSALPASAYVFLFKKTRGSVMISSSKAGEYSYGNPTVGGYATDGFFTALGQVSYQTAAQQQNIWRNVISKTTSNTHALCSNAPRKQTPQFKLEIQGVDNSEQNPVCAPDDEHAEVPDYE
jgi:hypothetical protein